MRKPLVLILLSVLSLAVIGVFHVWRLPLYEWTRPLMIAPIVLAGVYYRRAGSTAAAVLLYTMQTPFYYIQFSRDVGWGVNYCVANMFVCGLGIFLGHVIRIELENAATLNQIQETLDSMGGGADDAALLEKLEGMVRERGESDIVETYLFDASQCLVRLGANGCKPLPGAHLFYKVADSGQPLVSRFAPVDPRMAVAPSSTAHAPCQIAVFPLAWAGQTRGVMALADSRNENFGNETVAFISTLIQSVENQLELQEKRRTTIAHEMQRRMIRDTFSSYVSRSVAEEILKDPDRVDLGGKLLHVTVMFTEVINFQQLLKIMKPAELIASLNEYFSATIDTVFAHQGTLDKFMGDGVMAFWGAPLPMHGAEDMAVRCASALQHRIRVINQQWQEQGRPRFDVCIGINTGNVVAGNIGSIRRMEYTVIGDTVNVAARIKALSSKRNIPVLVSHSTRTRLSGDYPFTETMQAAVKGKSGAITVHRLAIAESTEHNPEANGQ